MKSTFNICFYAKKDKQKANGAYPLSVFVCRGYELGYELCLLGAKRCTLRQTQGNKKSPTNH